MKKLLTLLLTAIMAVACCFGLTACGEDKELKVGLICLHDENSTYDKNFIDAMKAACEAKGVTLIMKTGIPENAECKTAALDMVDQGCKVIFADSFGHEDYMLEAAKEHPEVQFCHATGFKSKLNPDVANYHNAFANIYEGRYLAGYAAGLKLNAMETAGQITATDIKIGYVGAFTYAEVISGLSSWYLGVKAGYTGAKAINMDVKFTGSWYDESKEANAATDLIDGGAILLSQHADSWGAPTTCETKGIPNVSYNGSTASRCPSTFIVSSRINWQPYYEYMIDCVKADTAIAKDWTAGFGATYKEGSVCLTDVGAAAAEGTEAALTAVVAELKAGTRKVFDTSKFTVEGVALTAEHATHGKYIKTVNGITFFDESNAEAFQSAPYFDLKIDGINFLNTAF